MAENHDKWFNKNRALCLTVIPIEPEMKTKRKIHFLSHLRVSLERSKFCDLILIEAKGHSDNELLGIARLEISNLDNYIAHDGILELDFVIHPIESSTQKKREWNICPVFRFEEFPDGLKGIRVSAMTNTELILWNN